MNGRAQRATVVIAASLALTAPPPACPDRAAPSMGSSRSSRRNGCAGARIRRRRAATSPARSRTGWTGRLPRRQLISARHSRAGAPRVEGTGAVRPVADERHASVCRPTSCSGNSRSSSEGEPFGDYDFPLEQFGGANVRLPNLMTVVHPVRTENDARNYLIRLRAVDDRLSEAIEEAARLAGRGHPPAALHPAVDHLADATVRGVARRRRTRWSPRSPTA